MLYLLMKNIAMRLCRAEWTFIIVVVLIAFTNMLSGCGKMGDLYLPDPATEQSSQKSE